MKAILIIGSFAILASLTSPNIAASGMPNTQKLNVSSVKPISFDRGEYSIVKLNYDRTTILSDDELISILKQAGFKGKELKMAWAIVIKESTGRPMALNKSSNCYGLFQINMTGAMGPDRREKYGLKSNEDLYNPLINAQIAYQMSNGGKNWSAWSTERSASKFVSEYPG